MESQPQNLEFRINPENFHPCKNVLIKKIRRNINLNMIICKIFLMMLFKPNKDNIF